MARRLASIAAAGAVLVGLLATAPPLASAEVDTTYGWDHRAATVSGTYQVVVGQFAGDEASDILFYGKGSAADTLWIGNAGERGQAGFDVVPLTIGGDVTLVVGDFGGDSYDDLLLYGKGAEPDALWTSIDAEAIFSKRAVTIGGTYLPTVLTDYRDGGKDDIVFLGPGATPDYLWHFTDSPGTTNYEGPGTYASRSLTVNGSYQLVPGDYSGDGIGDLVLYQPGTAADYKWVFNTAGAVTESKLTVNGTYRPVPILGVPYDAILWWADGTAGKAFWASNGSTFVAKPVPAENATGTVTPYGLGSAVIEQPGAGKAERQFFYDGTAASFYTLANVAKHDQTVAKPLVGNLDDDADGYLDIFWYGPGSARDELWYSPSTLAAKAAPAPSGVPVQAKPDGLEPR
ncbi:hypothetical protein KSP35_18835 [Aquihabitans sp. G128]|uniref:hypothetical protein n=1 Tax=Aquihabitans sp. G128 TaxID=2849779 RepID=UPI001C23BC6F|nr:hypothetical protein [Aquihabitans sp. G128]QXC60365.1 hypothetical protein KSP35_18835 [Aquihabitans sp. G128]